MYLRWILFKAATGLRKRVDNAVSKQPPSGNPSCIVTTATALPREPTKENERERGGRSGLRREGGCSFRVGAVFIERGCSRPCKHCQTHETRGVPFFVFVFRVELRANLLSFSPSLFPVLKIASEGFFSSR